MNEYEYTLSIHTLPTLAKQLTAESQRGWELVTMWPDPLQPSKINVVLRRQPLPQGSHAY